jgi:putative oxidoreductase
VPLLSPELAAYLGTFVELVFPVLLALGLMGRVAAGVLFLFNIVAVLSYPDLNLAGLEQHKIWGVMLLVSLLHGPGKWSLDYWLGRHFFTNQAESRSESS